MRARARRKFRGLLTLVAVIVIAGIMVLFTADDGVAAAWKRGWDRLWDQVASSASPMPSVVPSATIKPPDDTPETDTPPVAPPAAMIAAADLPWLLTVAAETRTPKYERARFEHWIDADADGCNTRYEVLLEESTTPITITDRCWLNGGTWVSVLDGGYAYEPGQLEIDHHIPLAEAWRSGASAWTDAERRAFANDLDVPYMLNAVSSVSNQSKGDKDPAKWLPSNTAHTCEYVITWALAKYRYSLSVDADELAALTRELSGDCGANPVQLPDVRR